MSRDSVIFDGDCGVCMALKDWVVGRDTAGNLEFIAFQTGNLEGVSPGLTPELASQALYFVGRDGRRFRGARAVFETMRRLPGLWGALGTVFSFPLLSFMAEPFYYLFARNRGRFSLWLGLDRCDVQGLIPPDF
jgi:predicted DCC family thiol-disulfide oxidoreductase YuxK